MCVLEGYLFPKSPAWPGSISGVRLRNFRLIFDWSVCCFCSSCWHGAAPTYAFAFVPRDLQDILNFCTFRMPPSPVSCVLYRVGEPTPEMERNYAVDKRARKRLALPWCPSLSFSPYFDVESCGPTATMYVLVCPRSVSRPRSV